MELPSTQQLAWLMVRPVSLLEVVDRQLLIHVSQDPLVDQVYTLAREFAAMVRERQVVVLNDWLVDCQNASVSLLQQFGLRLQQDYDAVRAALSTEWSNGQTEGPSDQSQAHQAADVWASQTGLTTATGTLPMLNHTKCVRASLQGGGQEEVNKLSSLQSSPFIE